MRVIRLGAGRARPMRVLCTLGLIAGMSACVVRNAAAPLPGSARAALEANGSGPEPFAAQRLVALPGLLALHVGDSAAPCADAVPPRSPAEACHERP